MEIVQQQKVNVIEISFIFRAQKSKNSVAWTEKALAVVCLQLQYLFFNFNFFQEQY